MWCLRTCEGPCLQPHISENAKTRSLQSYNPYKAQKTAILDLTLLHTLPAETLHELRMVLNKPENTLLHSYISRNSVTPFTRQLHTFIGDCHQVQLVRRVLVAYIPRGLSSEGLGGKKRNTVTPDAKKPAGRNQRAR